MNVNVLMHYLHANRLILHWNEFYSGEDGTDSTYSNIPTFTLYKANNGMLFFKTSSNQNMEWEKAPETMREFCEEAAKSWKTDGYYGPMRPYAIL